MTRWLLFWLLCGLAAVFGTASAAPGTVNVSAAVLSKNQCKFSANNATLAFGSIDPSTPASASTTLTVTCIGSDPTATFSVTQNSGSNSTGPGANRMYKPAAGPQPAWYLPYTLSLTPTSATIPKKGSQVITISGSIAVSDANNAHAGSYTDTVVLTVSP